MEHLPRVSSHLDAQVSNAVRRPDGTVILLDWAFADDGEVDEDLGDWLPADVFDLFWPAKQLADLEAACFASTWKGTARAAGRAPTPKSASASWPRS